MSQPDLAIVIYTCDRPDYAARTLRSTLDNLKYSGPVHLHIADDGSPDGQVDALLRIAAHEYGINATSSNAGRSGYGASYNLATQYVHMIAEVFLCLEDDWELTRELDLNPLVEALQDERIDCIRLGYIGFTSELRGTIISAAGQAWLLFDSGSSERHVFAGHPRLETLSFERRVGPWPEGENAGSTEFIVAGRDEARRGIVWPMDIGLNASPGGGSYYAHIGTIQARTDQR